MDAEYAQVAHALKRLAQSLDAPVLCLTQLNRANEQRADKRPMLSDLRESGAAEEDADGVLLLYRDDYYGKQGGSGSRRSRLWWTCIWRKTGMGARGMWICAFGRKRMFSERGT